jgi:propionaldehyde dehydrogenase
MESVRVDDLVKKIVEKVTKELAQEGKGRSSVGETVKAAVEAQKAWQWDYNLDARTKILSAIKSKLLPHAEELAKLARDDTDMGRLDDKILKKKLAITKTPGPEYFTTKAISGDNGLILEELAPFGVIASITPSTNPVATVINNTICMLSGGNGVVFSPHPGALRCTLKTVELIRDILAEEGAPVEVVSVLSDASLDSLKELMSHPDIKLISATGGPGVVKAALSSGKPAIGAGPGNPPVLVDETAHLEKAAKDVIAGASFDNNLPCIAEKELIAVNCIADELKELMCHNGAYELKDRSKVAALVDLVLTKDHKIKKDMVGKDASVYLEKLGITPPPNVRLILVECDEKHPFVQEELMMPILAMVRVADFKEGLAMAKRVEHGFRHSAIIHSTNIDNMSDMAKTMETSMFVKNAPSFASIGVGGDCPTAFTIGTTTGHGPTTPLSFCRIRRCVLHGAFRIV